MLVTVLAKIFLSVTKQPPLRTQAISAGTILYGESESSKPERCHFNLWDRAIFKKFDFLNTSSLDIIVPFVILALENIPLSANIAY